jgi:hypothetical protein
MDILEVTDGREAFQKTKTLPPDVIFYGLQVAWGKWHRISIE